MKFKINVSNIELLKESENDLLWRLYKSYHHEVSGFKDERELTSEEQFKSFWGRSDQPVFILFSKQKAIGFVLLQKISQHTNYGNYLEIGAIYVTKKSDYSAYLKPLPVLLNKIW